MDDELRLLIGENEKILYAGKPDKKCFVLESILNGLLPLSLVWGLIDYLLLGRSLAVEDPRDILDLLFLLVHLLPVWMYLGIVITTPLRYKNHSYVVTDKAIYQSEGIFRKRFLSKPFAELSHVDLHRGMFDQWLGVGDVITTSDLPTPTPNGRASYIRIAIEDIPDYLAVYELVKKLQEDVYSDVMYPNALRPQKNHGSRTKYQGAARAPGKLARPTKKCPKSQS